MTAPEITGFEILEKLGTGGMATVWKARQLSLDRIVAIKVLPTQLASDPADIERFQREAQATAKLKNSGIVQVYDANAESGVYYFVMEYVAGYTVGDWIRRKHVLTPDEALTVGECVARSLDYAWRSAGMIHCDIKPDNVLIDADGTVKVADLGLSRTISAMMADSASDEIMGTPAYMAPEQVEGAADLDCRADIYALGGMLYHLVTGKMLFQGNPEEQIMVKQVTEQVEDALDVHPKVPHSVCWLLERMLAKDRAHRPHDWAEVLSDLERVKSGIPPAAKLPPGATSTMRRSRRRRERDFARQAAKAKAKPAGTGLGVLTTVVVVVAAAVGGYHLLSLQGWVPALKLPAAGGANAATNASVRTPPVDPALARAQQRFAEAETYARQHPLALADVAAQFDRVAVDTAGTRFAQEAAGRARQAREQLVRETQFVLDRLHRQAERSVQAGNFAEAIRLYEAYDGPLAARTADGRKSAVAALRTQQAAAATAAEERAAILRQRAEQALQESCALVVSGRVADAHASLVDVAKELAGQQGAEELRSAAIVLGRASRIDAEILQTFASAVGTVIPVELAGGARNVQIVGVANGSVQALDRTDGGAGRELSLTAKDLGLKERLTRLGMLDGAHVGLVRGALAAGAKAYGHARTSFQAVPVPYRDRLLAAVVMAEQAQNDGEAERAFRRLLTAAGLTLNGELDLEAVRKRLADVGLTEDERTRLRDLIAAFRAVYGQSAFARKAEPCLADLASRIK